MLNANTSAPLPYGISPPGHRLPDRTRVGDVNLQVSALRESLPYYELVMGLSPRDIPESATLSVTDNKEAVAAVWLEGCRR